MALPPQETPDATTWRPLARPPRVGDLVSGKYRLTRTLGRGGMGRIFAAHHIILDTVVALKFMHPHLTRDAISLERFAREARAAAMLKSPYSARILDVDQLPSGEPYIVMEYLEGLSLEEVAESGRGLAIADAVTFVAQACEALAEAHARGIIHRDVKPANLFVTRAKSGDRIVKVLDFGLAKSALPDQFAGDVESLGTPRYMSPEQVRGGHHLDARTDVWSLGATLYELLAGRPAFPGAEPSTVFTRILQGAYLPLRTLRPEVPPALAAIVERCLAADPAARFGSVSELAAALEGRLAPRATARRFAQTMPSASSAGRSEWTTPASAMSMSVREPHANGPTLRQTILAALAGPALIAGLAAGFAITLATRGADARGAARASTWPAAESAQPATVVHVTARAEHAAPRAKAPATVTVSPWCTRHPRCRICATAARE